MTPSGPVGIEVTGVAKQFGSTPVLQDVSVAVQPGSTLALLGPSGCGKTTLLRLISGLERPDAGIVRIGERIVAGPGLWVPPEHRRVGMVFQDWALFPHLSVHDNVGFGLPKAQRRSGRVGQVLDMVDLAGQARRLPGTLSGGQQQRVALARALAPAPDVLLLDEPFSNLDASLRVQVRRDVRALLNDIEITAVFVTHDQEEAFYVGDQVAVLYGGRMVQQGAPAEIYTDPVTPWVAGFVGEANLVPGDARGAAAETSVGAIPLRGSFDGAVVVLVRPEDMTVQPGGPGEVLEVEYYGHDCAYRVAIDGLELRVRAETPPVHRRGDPVQVVHRGDPAVAWASEPAIDRGR